jgi:hypothetical protein
MDDIAAHGWSDIAVFPTKDDPGQPFNYTVGLGGFDHPELMVMGLPNQQLHQMLWSAFKSRIAVGRRYTADTYADDVLVDHRVAFVEVLDLWDEDYPLSMVRRFYGEAEALQMVWPDSQDRFPWHDDFDTRYLDRQLLRGPWRGEDQP